MDLAVFLLFFADFGPKMGFWSQVLTVRKLAGWFLSKFQVVLGMFDAFSIFSTRFTAKNRYFYREKWDLAVFLLFFADFGPRWGPGAKC